MKKVLLSVMALGMLTACNVHFTQRVKAQAEEQRPLKGFERIELLGSLDVKYEQADSFSVLVNSEGD